MSRMNKGNDNSVNEQRVLRGYRRMGKRFIPPFLQHMSLTESRWMDDRVPELIWIALLIQVFGLKRGTEIALKIAKSAAKCGQPTQKAFAAASDYTMFKTEHGGHLCLELMAAGVLEEARRGLAALIDHYPEFPLSFLGKPEKIAENAPVSTLDDLGETIVSINDREGYAGTFAQATVVCIYFANDQLKVFPNTGLSNFPAIEEYPMTEESLKVAASVRSAVTGLLAKGVSPDWRNSFWNQGRSLGPCEVA